MDIIETFITDINALSEKFIQNVLRVIQGTQLTREEMEVLIMQIDFLKDAKVSKRLDEFFNEYDDEIVKIVNTAKARGIGALGQITADRINTIKTLDFDFILKRGSMFEAELRSELFKQITEGISSKEIMDKILPMIQSKVTYAPNWFGSALNTAYQQYNASSMQELFINEPEARWRLPEILDERTRPACEAAVRYQPVNGYTIKEINAGAWTRLVQEHAAEFAHTSSELRQALNTNYNFVNRGGFGCRHQPELI